MEPRDKQVELPAPTSAPIMLAFGVALVFAGLATHGIMSVMGAVLAIGGMVAWFKQVLPVEAHEQLPVLEEAVEVVPSGREIEQVKRETGQIRAVLPLEIYPISAGVRGGIAGGVAMAILAVIYGVASGHGVWYPINLLAAGFLPSASMAQMSGFFPTALAIAVVIHAVTSVLVGVLYGALLPMLPRRPILLGGLIAPTLWSGLLYSSLSLINPLMAERIDWLWFFVSQIGFGVVAGVVVSRRARIALLQPLPFAMRAGIERGGMHGEDKP